MKIAIIGATSEIAKDLTLLFSAIPEYSLMLYARNLANLINWLNEHRIFSNVHLGELVQIGEKVNYDVIINCIGIGNPSRIEETVDVIKDATYKYDDMILEYLQHYPETKYIYLSSGAVFNSDFNNPVDDTTKIYDKAELPTVLNYYGYLKADIERRHRFQKNLNIVDIRLFNYFSHRQNFSTSFFMSNVVNAILRGEVFKTSEDSFWRDYITPPDLFQLILKVVKFSPLNRAFNVYSLCPVEKFHLLNFLAERFGLKYEVDAMAKFASPTGLKNFYFSQGRGAEIVGYKPQLSSITGLERELCML